MKVKSLSHVLLLATPWTAAYQAPLSWNFPGKSIGVGCHCLLRARGLEGSKTLHLHWLGWGLPRERAKYNLGDERSSLEDLNHMDVDPSKGL